MPNRRDWVVRVLSTLRPMACALLLVGQPAAVGVVHAQGTGGGDIDMAAIGRCQDSLSDTYGLSNDDPAFLDALTLCYSVETAPDTPLDPLPVADSTPNDGAGCFSDGSKVMVSQAEIAEMTQWGRDNGRTLSDVKSDIEGLNASRGGSGSSVCPKMPPPPPAANAGVKCNSDFDSIDDAIAWEQGRVKDAEAHLKKLELETRFWKLSDGLTNWQLEFYIMDRVLNEHNMAVFDPDPPAKRFAAIDLKYHKPRYGDFVAPGSMVLVDLHTAIPAWQASPDGQSAQAEKGAYATFDDNGNLIGGIYKDKVDRLAEYRTLPRSGEDLARKISGPAQRLKDIQEQQDSEIVVLQRAQQDLNVWTQAKANGISCSFSTGRLGQPIYAPVPRADPLFVFVLKGIGFVTATQKDVATTAACVWNGGGPRPCPGAAPAQVDQKWGGPYATDADARKDLKSKLDCSTGFWGDKGNVGKDGYWLQNNVSTADCKTINGKATP